MPRLAPRFNGQPAVIEHRITLGDYERKQLVKQIEKTNQLNNLKIASNLSTPLLLAGAGFASFYFISKSIDNIARVWGGLPLDNLQQSIRKGGNAIQGFNSDGSYPTILTHTEGRYPEGTVRVFQPGITGGFGSTAFLATINTDQDMLVIGNFNKDAVTVDQLSEGWLPYSQWKEANEDGREYVS